MRILAIALGAFIALIQVPLWLGKGGWVRVWDMDNHVSAQRAKNAQLEARNASLAAEVRDLKTGTEAIEERARYELGMVKNDEIFFQVIDQPQNRGQSPISPSTPSAPKKP